jgi:PadR family transcriptional regulator PadR
MADGPRISHTSAMILQAIGIGHIYGYTVMEVTGLASGTVYPALRRLERDQLIGSQWERQSIAEAALRPARRYYKLTRSGEAAVEASRKRYPLLAKLASKEEEVQDVCRAHRCIRPSSVPHLSWRPANSAPSGWRVGDRSSGIFRRVDPRCSVWAHSRTRFGCGGTVRAHRVEPAFTSSRPSLA